MLVDSHCHLDFLAAGPERDGGHRARAGGRGWGRC